MQISLEEFLKQLMKQWKMIGIIVVLCTVLFVGTAAMFGKEISVPHSEEYLYYEEKLNWHEEYLKESVLMSINPTKIHVQTVFLQNISSHATMENYVTSSEIWEEFESDTAPFYMSELVEWREITEEGIVELSLRHGTTEECEKCLNYLMARIRQEDTNIEVIPGSETIEVDTELTDLQNDWYNRIDYLKDKLEESEAGFTIQINLVAAAITGMLVGCFCSVIIVLIIFMVKRKID